MIPSTDKIVSTFPRKYISVLPGHNRDRFAEALRTIEEGIEAGKIWNQEFLSAKSWIATGCEHAQHVAGHDAWQTRGKRSGYGDCRDQIGSAFSMNQAAKMSRNLKKLAKRFPDVLRPEIAEYITTLDQIDAVWNWLKRVRPLIVKGRKPNVENKTPEQLHAEMTNTGNCAICENRQKLLTPWTPGDIATGKVTTQDIRTRIMVHHGYEMSEYNHAGSRMGSCFGAFKPPYEVSCEANRLYRRRLEGELSLLKDYLAALNASEHDTLTVSEYQNGQRDPVQVPYARGTAKYEREREHRIGSTEHEIRSTASRIAHQTTKIDTWKPEPLYDEAR